MLSKIFSPANKNILTPQEVIQKFESEFISNEFTSPVSEKFRDYMNFELNNHKEFALQELSINKKIDSIRHIFSGIQKALLIKYLDENSYIEPLINKTHDLIYKDDYGDLIIDDASEEIRSFAKKRLPYILSATDYKIRNEYQFYLKSARELIEIDDYGYKTDQSIFLLFKHNDDISDEDIIYEIGSMIFDVVLSADEHSLNNHENQ